MRSIGQPDTIALQISTDLETIRESERILQISTDLKVVRKTSIIEKQTHTALTRSTAADPNTTHQHLTTKI
jgi:hypothetical protein